MTIMEQITALKGARDILDKSYIKHRVNDGQGGVCAQGALIKQLNANPAVLNPEFCLLHEILVRNAKALHPELTGRIYYNNSHFGTSFDVSPVVFINDYLGKEEILKVFDSAILELEIVAPEPPPAVEEPKVDLEPLVEEPLPTREPVAIVVMKEWPYMDTAPMTFDLVGTGG